MYKAADAPCTAPVSSIKSTIRSTDLISNYLRGEIPLNVVAAVEGVRFLNSNVLGLDHQSIYKNEYLY